MGLTNSTTTENLDNLDIERNEPEEQRGRFFNFLPPNLYFGTTQLLFSSNDGEEVFGFPSQTNQEGDALSRIADLSKVSKTTIVKSPVNLNKVSLQLLPVEDEPDVYNVQFIFDCNTSCAIRIFYAADESNLNYDTQAYFFERGLGQRFITTAESALRVKNYNEEDLQYKDDSKYPVVIVIEAVPGEESLSKEKKIVSQTTLANLLKCSDDTYEIKPICQKIIYGGTTYIVHDIFGIDQNSTTAPEECVICMSEMRDTVVIPCRHMCVCHQCAQVLHYQSNKCPICRGSVRSMLKIKISKSSKIDESKNDGVVIVEDGDVL